MRDTFFPIEIPFVFTIETALTRRRHTREFDGNIGTETTIPFFHFFLFLFLFFSRREIDHLLFILLAADDI